MVQGIDEVRQPTAECPTLHLLLWCEPQSEKDISVLLGFVDFFGAGERGQQLPRTK